MSPAIRIASALFFVSGAAALIFETLWFRRAGLAFGNSVWASALVLSSFMAGMAVGNAIAARVAQPLRRPLRVVAALELAIACIGVLLVVVLPTLGPALAPLFGPLLPSPWLVQPLRFAVAFCVLVAPAVAMGATLPLLVHALRARVPEFGHLLGRLYGWNTLGAMTGALSAELLWIPLGGIYGAAAAAAGMNLLAAAGALWLDVREANERAPAAVAPSSRLPREAWHLLLAAALSGALALGFEVVWFRVGIQYLPNSSAMFAWMLAVVLGGIALGSLAAGAGFRRLPSLERAAPAVAAAAAGLAVLSHAAVPVLITPILEQMESLTSPPGALFLSLGAALSLCIALMLPVSFASGLLFAMLGKRLELKVGLAGRTTGLLALSNSAGSAVGPLLVGFVLLPRLGVDGSTLLLGSGYLVVAALAWNASSARAPAVAATIASAAALIAFPHGLHERTLVRLIQAEYGSDEEVVAVREGIVETAVVTRVSWRGEPQYHRLVTDGYTMAGQSLASKRYMKLFAYLPAAFHPGLERALLISFGVGNTASALTDLDELERIDVVDISPEILSLAGTIHGEGGENPLEDPRVRVHVEDGRYFLQTATDHYDLITAEPPPPAFAGVVNLYTREYFALIRDRLELGGFASYWLPASQMRPVDSQAIIGAFCAVFRDCSLWEADPADWILLGSRDATTPVSLGRIEAIFDDARTGQSLRAIGVEAPAALGALFLADSVFLEQFAAATPPLVDAHPERAPAVVSSWMALPDSFAWIRDVRARGARLASGSSPGSLWPRSLVEASVAELERANAVRMMLFDPPRPIERRMRELHTVLTTTLLESPVLWILGSDEARSRSAETLAARGDTSPDVEHELGVRALAQRRYRQAAEHFARAARSERPTRDDLLYAYALRLDGDDEAARRAAAANGLAESPDLGALWREILEWPAPTSRATDRPSS